MKHVLLTISLIFGATAASAAEKVWAFNITHVRVPMLYDGNKNMLLHMPEGIGVWSVYRDIEKCRSELQTYVLQMTASSKVELKDNDTFKRLNPSAVLYNSIDGILQYVECSPKFLQD